MARDQALGLDITELRLGPPGSKASCGDPAMEAAAPATKKRSFAEVAAESEGENEEVVEDPRDGKAQKVVGWPPICSYRKNSFMGKAERERSTELYVKVSMDGAPFLRKMHLKSHNGYADLSRVLATMFSNLSLDDDCGNSEYMTVYEDRDGDWMLVGDVPWEMFLESCKRLRITRRTDAINFGDGFGHPKIEIPKWGATPELKGVSASFADTDAAQDPGGTENRRAFRPCSGDSAHPNTPSWLGILSLSPWKNMEMVVSEISNTVL